MLAATAALGTTPPGTLLAQAAPALTHKTHGQEHAGQHLALATEGFTAEMAIFPGRTGRNYMTVALRDPGGRALDAPEVTLRLSNPVKGIAPLERPAERTGPGL